MGGGRCEDKASRVALVGEEVGGSYGIRRWVWRHTRGLQNLSAVMGGERSHALCARNRALVEMYSVTSKVNMDR